MCKEQNLPHVQGMVCDVVTGLYGELVWHFWFWLHGRHAGGKSQTETGGICFKWLNFANV